MGRISRRMIVAITAAVLLVAAGVVIGILSQRGSTADAVLPDGSRLEDVAASQAALPLCVNIFIPGEPVDTAMAKAGCKDLQGQTELGGWGDCTDGRTLFTINPGSGAPAGWGFGGEPFHEVVSGDIAGDPGYAEAFEACT